MAVLLGSIYSDRLKKLSRKNYIYDKETDSFINDDIKMFPAHLKRQFGIARYFVRKADKKTFTQYLKDRKLL
jgi:hypothetical protein